MSRVQLVELTALSDKAVETIKCSDAERDLATTIADHAFNAANEGVSPKIYVEVAAIILARTAHDAIANLNHNAPMPIDPRRGEAFFLSCALDRAAQLIAERRELATRAKSTNWQKIVDEYSELLSRSGSTPLIRDVTELPYPREIIRAAILHCLAIESRPTVRGALRAAHKGLAAYQVLTPAERAAVHTFCEQTLPGLNAPLDDQKNLAANLSGKLPTYQAVMHRFQTDAEKFAGDLR